MRAKVWVQEYKAAIYLTKEEAEAIHKEAKNWPNSELLQRLSILIMEICNHEWEVNE